MDSNSFMKKWETFLQSNFSWHLQKKGLKNGTICYEDTFSMLFKTLLLTEKGIMLISLGKHFPRFVSQPNVSQVSMVVLFNQLFSRPENFRKC